MDMNTQISLDVIIGLGSGIIGSVGAYIKMKSKLDRLEMENISQERDILELKDSKKNMNSVIHKRIDEVQNNYDELQREVHKGQQSLETKMAQMELRIVKEIQKLNR
jgi:hypothetical protein